MTLVAVPLAIGSVVHLYPNAFFNVIVLVPTLMWSMYLLYRGLPVVLRTDPGRGMLMASALIAYLLVSWVTLLGITAVSTNGLNRCYLVHHIHSFYNPTKDRIFFVKCRSNQIAVLKYYEEL